MIRASLRLAAFLILAGSSGGCALIDLGPWGGPAYTLDTGRLGSGEPALELRNDSEYIHGQPVDARRNR
jgi:hypothetical protein